MSQDERMAQRFAIHAEKIAWHARVWRQADRDAIADRGNEQKKHAEYWARQALRQAIDTAQHS